MHLSRFRLPVIWTCSIVGVFSFLHLIGVYIYEGGSVLGVPGGSISIGLVGQSPDIPDPLKFGQNKQHDLILSFLFRSLIRYDSDKGVYEGELGGCDLADLSKVVCKLSLSGTWSDGTAIQIDDVVATYQAFKENPPNDKMKGFLSKVAIVEKDASTVELSSSEKNSLMLDLLSYPILRSDMIERIRTGRLGIDGYVTSGAYTFLEKEKNTQYGYDKITIQKNEKTNTTSWLDKYNFLFFPDAGSLERGADVLGIIVPPDTGAKMLLGPRFDSYEYTMYEYLGLFLNTDTISNPIRKNILLQAESGLSGTVVKSERPIAELFPRNEKNRIKIEKNLADTMRETGYTKVDESLAILEKETGMLTGSSIDYGNSVYIDTPSKKRVIWSEVAEGEITISGNVPLGVKNVIINGYILKEFLPGNNRFSYKVNLTDKTLIEGGNTYILEFEGNDGTKTVRDTLTLYYYRDSAKMTEVRTSVDAEYLAKLNTEELVKERLKGVNERKIKLQALNPRYYYNNTLAPYELDLMYLSDPGSLEGYATTVSDTLLSLGIKVNISVMSSKDFSLMLAKGEKNYDMLIIGFEANGRFSRIGQIFLSSEAKKGINFAKVESKTLDALFASLRISYIKETTDTLLTKIADYMQSEAFFLPISSPLHTFSVDKNLKGIQKIMTFQDITTLYNVIRKASIKEEYVLNTSGKGVGGFFGWLWSKSGL